MDKYIKNYILSVANTIAGVAFPLITFPYVTRVLGPANLGIVNFAQAYGYYFMHIASFGINSYAIRELSKVRNDNTKVYKVGNEIFNLNIFFSILSTLMYFIGVFSVDIFHENLTIFTIYSVVILTNFLSLDWVLQSFDDYCFSTVRNLIIRIVSVLAVFVFVQEDTDFVIYMVITCIAEMGTKISTLLYSRKYYVKWQLKWRFLNFKKHISSMFTLFTFRLVNGISANLDKLMIGFMMAYANVGVYTAGVKFALMASAVVEMSGIVLFPKINISANRSMDEYLRNVKLNYDIILLLGLPMSVCLFLISGRLVPLLSGEEFVDAVSVARIMASIILIGPIVDMLGSKTLLVFNKDKWLLRCSGYVAVSNVVLNFLFIPLWGVDGAALASFLSYIVAVSSRYFFTRKLVKVDLLTKTLWKYTSFTIPFVICYSMFRLQIDTNTFWMFVFVMFCILIYVIELFLSKDNLWKMIMRKTFWKG